MIWTTNKPTKAGWYWFKDVGPDGSTRSVDILRVFWEAPCGKDNEYGGYWAWSVDSLNSDHEQVDNVTGYWSSEPIPEPQEQG